MLTTILKKISFLYKNERKKIIFIIVFLFIVIAGIIVGNRYLVELPKQGGVINEIIIDSKVRFINPTIAISQVEKDMLPLIYSPLSPTMPSKNNNIADITLQADKKSYLITLKNNITFTNGQILNSDDVIFTIKKIQDPFIKSPMFSEFFGIDIKKIDDFSLEIRTEKEYSQITNAFAKLYILPKKPWENIDYPEFPFSNLNTKPIGSGPFFVESSLRDDRGITKNLELKRNDKYYKNTYIDGIKFHFFENVTDYTKSLIYSSKGQIKNITLVSPASIPDVLLKNSEIKKLTSSRIFGLFLNPKNKFLDDNNLRQALSWVIDRDEITNSILKGYAKSLDSILFQQDKNIDIAAHKNIEEVAKYLKDKKYILKDGQLYTKNNEKVALNISVLDGSDEFSKVVNYLTSEFNKLGIHITIVNYTENQFLDEVIRNRDFDIVFFGYQTDIKADYFHLFHSLQTQDPGLNISNISDTKIDELIMQLRANVSTTKRQELEEKLNELIISKNLFIPLYNPYYIYIVDNRIKNFKKEILNSIENRFDNVSDWYIRTKKVLPFFVD